MLAKARGLTIAQLCARAGIAHSTFTRWRSGRTSPTLDVYQRLVDVARGASVARDAPAPAAEQAA
jgi:transcriptional regulator with XRE-family HTH domain